MYSIIFKRACVTSCDVQRSQCQAGVLSVPHTGATKRRHYFRLTQKKNNSKFNNQIPTDHTTQQITPMPRNVLPESRSIFLYFVVQYRV
jgi:hypothetical protein